MREGTAEGMINRFMLNSPYRTILSAACEVYEKNRNMNETIAAIDRGYSLAEQGHKEAGLRSQGDGKGIRMEIDMANALTLIRAKKLGLKFPNTERPRVERGGEQEGGCSRYSTPPRTSSPW